MLEALLFESEKKLKFLNILFITFIVTLILGFFNFIIGGISLFLIIFVTLSFAYPVINYAKSVDLEELEHAGSQKNFFKRYERELVIFWALFVGCVLGFYILNIAGFTSDFTYEENFVNSVTGKIIQDSELFLVIFFHNLQVALFTFILSLLVFSGLVFILVWNASIVAYYLFTLGSYSLAALTGFSLLSHGLLEIAGYVFSGLGGGILSYRLHLLISKKKNFISRKILNKRLFLDLSYLLLFAVFFIFLAALVEVL